MGSPRKRRDRQAGREASKEARREGMEGRRMCVGVRGCGRGEAQSHDHFLLSSSLSFSLSPYLSLFLSVCLVQCLHFGKQGRKGRKRSEP
jgi:hypothetical protein